MIVSIPDLCLFLTFTDIDKPNFFLSSGASFRPLIGDIIIDLDISEILIILFFINLKVCFGISKELFFETVFLSTLNIYSLTIFG